MSASIDLLGPDYLLPKRCPLCDGHLRRTWARLPGGLVRLTLACARCRHEVAQNDVDVVVEAP